MSVSDSCECSILEHGFFTIFPCGFGRACPASLDFSVVAYRRQRAKYATDLGLPFEHSRPPLTSPIKAKAKISLRAPHPCARIALDHLRTIKCVLVKALMATYSRQLLSRHKTTATYGGQEEGSESMLKVRH